MNKMISLDTETTGLDLRHGAKPYLVTICNDQGENTWWEWDVDPLTREPAIPNGDLEAIQGAVDAADKIVLQNPKFDVAALQTVFNGGLRWDWGKVRDTLLAGHLLASNEPHDLTTMTLVYLGFNSGPFEERIKKASEEARKLAKKEFPDWRIARKGLPEMPSAKEKVWKFDMWLPRAILAEGGGKKEWADLVAEYANNDSLTTIILYKEMRKRLKKRKLWDIYLDRLEILPVVYRMEKNGVTINKHRLREKQQEYTEESKKCSEVCLDIAAKYDYPLVLPKSGNNKSLTTFIFDHLELDPVKRSKKTGKPSLDKEVMQTYLDNLPKKSDDRKFIQSLCDKRKRDTALNYMEGYERFWLPVPTKHKRVDGFRLFPSLNPTGTDTLRWSSNNPNEQNISKKTGFNLRYSFGPIDGREWWALDYDNLELRIPAYEADEREMIRLFERPDEAPFFGSYHLLVCSILHPTKWNACLQENVSFKKKFPELYGKTKNGNFANQYGAILMDDGWGTADKAYGVRYGQAKVQKRLSKIAKLNNRMIKQSKKLGYVETVPDLEVDPTKGYPLLCGRNRWGGILATVPLNYHVQGTACWIMCRAMVKVQKYLDTIGPEYKMIMNVHDEIVLDFPKGKKRNLPKVRRIKHIMESVGDCVGIPLTCGIDYHPNNWSEGITV